jgi:hypothetical protein
VVTREVQDHVKPDRLQLLAELDGAVLAVVESIVVEEDFLDIGEALDGRARFGRHIVGGALAPPVAECVCGHRQKVHSAGQPREVVERDERVEQERDVVARDVQIALVGLGHPRQRVQVLDIEGLSLGKLDDREVELAAADEVECGTLVESAVGVSGDGWPDEADLHGRVGSLDGLRQALVACPADGRREQDQELVVLADLDGLIRGNVVRVGIEQPRTLQQSGRISQPDGVPIGLNLARSGPARTRATVKVLERGRIQQKRFQGHRHPFHSNIPVVYQRQNPTDLVYFPCNSCSQSSMWPRARSRPRRALASSREASKAS